MTTAQRFLVRRARSMRQDKLQFPPASVPRSGITRHFPFSPFPWLSVFMRRTLCLASKSPRRREILEKAGFEFRTFSLEISENLKENLRLDDALMDLTRRKAGHLIDTGTLT